MFLHYGEDDEVSMLEERAALEKQLEENPVELDSESDSEWVEGDLTPVEDLLASSDENE